MKQLISLLLIPAFAAPAAALTVRENSSRSGYSNQCFEQVYREEYIPGTRERPGRVRRWTETREIPCGYAGSPGNTIIQEDPFPINPRPSVDRNNADNNSCIEGALLGGILGGGAGYASSRGDGRGWAIPLGIVAGSMVGCQIDGG